MHFRGQSFAISPKPVELNKKSVLQFRLPIILFCSINARFAYPASLLVQTPPNKQDSTVFSDLKANKKTHLKLFIRRLKQLQQLLWMCTRILWSCLSFECLSFPLSGPIRVPPQCINKTYVNLMELLVFFLCKNVYALSYNNLMQSVNRTSK